MRANWLETLVYVGVFGTGLLLMLAWSLKKTSGLFFARSLNSFREDREKPEFERERRVGQLFSTKVLKYVPPFFIGFVLLMCWLVFKK